MPHKLSPYLVQSEQVCVDQLIESLDWDTEIAAQIAARAEETIEIMRGTQRPAGAIESFFATYGLNTLEGIALMCLAEALLRIPDAGTANALIRDKVAGTAWVQDKIKSPDWMLRMAGMGLNATRGTLEGPLAKLGEPVIRAALIQGMKILGGQFVIGQNVAEGLKSAATLEKDKGYLFSYDMLGEGARTKEDAARYFEEYARAIDEVGKNRLRREAYRPGVSVKLSALYPRYSASQEDHCIPALTNKLQALARQAAGYNICLTVDAEESERLETSLKIIRHVIEDISITGWDGFGLAVQAYDKRAPYLIDNLIELASKSQKHIQIRLVKGAYWDSEIKKAQIKGYEDYPVYTRKTHTDISYLLCAQKLLAARSFIYPMFGTHNAYTVQAIIKMAGTNLKGFEFQRLFGMGEALYDHIRAKEDLPVRIYAPIGEHKDLLPYLVRRLLENGASSSFVSKVFNTEFHSSELAKDPVALATSYGGLPHHKIQLPRYIFMDRLNSKGVDLDDASSLQALLSQMTKSYERRDVFASSIVGGASDKSGSWTDIRNPADKAEIVGTSYGANDKTVERAFTAAKAGYKEWSVTRAANRAGILYRIAMLYEDNLPLLMSLCVHEAGKTISDALAEVREAIDFCRYYAVRGEYDFDEDGVLLPSYTGEQNRILLGGRGVFACISPWNFPLAIFTGQIVAALMAGNTVVAKPAEQTPLIASAAIKLMHQAGVPENVLNLVIGDGRVGEMIVSHADVAGVAFTGSTSVAQSINRALASKDGAIVPLIAETGGQNAIVADSSALPEQIVDDVIVSAFGSAGQRCSAARVLYVQDEIADKVISMLKGAIEELRVGNPALYSTDIGPVIDEEALANLQRHRTSLDGFGRLVAEAPLSSSMKALGHYFVPVAYEINDIDELSGEVFGPILHIVRWRSGDLDNVLKKINDTGFGLTFGIHTRIDDVAKKAASIVTAGNVYVNRSIIGAVVGVQPFGGNGLSGTGPKAGGPHYLQRFASEKVISVNTTAAGGNASLVMLDE
jgi:RHH-type proline utilization regulon transcriptional repressor/proline dehydrogenase/delta 1-pyrroline-5-carboxylate dehydrogenase